MRPNLLLLSATALIAGCASSPSHPAKKTSPNVIEALNPDVSSAALQASTARVVETERAFAKSMADRNFKAFVTFLSPEAVFFSGNSVRHGAAEVAEQWRGYFDAPAAPFSWTPDHVEVLPSGQLALSSGPVYVQGKQVGRFNSIWRMDSPNTWHIVFDKGEAVCTPTQ